LPMSKYALPVAGSSKCSTDKVSALYSVRYPELTLHACNYTCNPARSQFNAPPLGLTHWRGTGRSSRVVGSRAGVNVCCGVLCVCRDPWNCLSSKCTKITSMKGKDGAGILRVVYNSLVIPLVAGSHCADGVGC
jgi:hypothetical protein